MTVLLDAPQRFENLCAIARTLDAFGLATCLVHDAFGLVRPRYGKVRRRVARSVSAGAFERVEFVRVGPPETVSLPGRRIATVRRPGAVSLHDVRFEPADTLLFGSEAAGLSAGALATADVHLTVPMQGGAESLNLSVAVAVVLYEARRQLGRLAEV